MATSGRVYAALRDGIVRGTLAPGARLVEIDIAQRLGVSRTPVREALTRLEREGYVATASGKRARPTVAPLTKDDVSELLYIVGELESLAAHRAALLAPAPRRTLLRALTRINASFLRASKKRVDFNRLYEADEEFHRKYIEAGAGPRLRALHEAVKPQAERYIRMYVSLLAREAPVSAGEHQAIISAIRAGDAPAAERAVQTNWRHAADRLSRAIGDAGERGGW
ncbi:MAG TPA: GntR family transcriptional regulator [Gemmatimonadales bacterium]|jgi:DNA-binding GntR family transcriptional regulator|nr:GntR family transcriptional regulator [Gemmatimonadales bacterium]